MASNTVVLEGIIMARDVLRLTPGGTAALNLTLKHESQQREGTQDVTVDLEMNAVAFGDVAEALNALTPNAAVSLKGFLSRKNRFSPTPILHITQFKLVK